MLESNDSKKTLCFKTIFEFYNLNSEIILTKLIKLSLKFTFRLNKIPINLKKNL